MEHSLSKNRAMRRSDVSSGKQLLDKLREGRLVLVFQPVKLFDRQDAGPEHEYLYSEALLRMMDDHDDEGALHSCASLIAALERTRGIQHIDISVIWTVISLLERHKNERLSCNVSAVSLSQQNVRHRWLQVLCYLTINHNVAQRLTIEITKTSDISNDLRELSLLAAIRACGTRIAIDDLGAGFTSFEFLEKLRPDVIKIDRSELLRACRDASSTGLLDSLVQFCTYYNSCIVVEGVEKEEELEAVRHSGANGFQGFFESPPNLQPAWLDLAPAVVQASIPCFDYGSLTTHLGASLYKIWEAALESYDSCRP